MSMRIDKRRLVSAALAAGLAAGTVVLAQNGTPINPHSNNLLTVAVYGDSPYGVNRTDTTQNDLTPAFIASINDDPKVDVVVHLGDIHSGSQLCTEAYDRTIFDLWGAFKNPLIFIPGDNEWSDCQKAKQGGHEHDSAGNPVDYADGDPIANLELVRSIFFPLPGYALGGGKKRLLTQAHNYDGAHPTDGNYVENVMWEQSKVLFVTLNIPGGNNNDDDNWFKLPRTQAQTDEIAQRTQADLRWLAAAFAQAQADNVQGVAILQQADMWDLDGNPVTHLANYEVFINGIAAQALAFGKPVLLLEGDSHHYRSDNPFRPAQPCVFEAPAGTDTVACNSMAASATFTPDAWTNHPIVDVPNIHRVVVHGSTTPLEWIRLTIAPGTNAPAGPDAFGPFSWERIIPLR